MSGNISDSKDFHVSWEEMHRNSKALAWRLIDKGPWDGIVAITRGGMVTACIVARELDIKLIETFCISSYDHKDNRGPDIIKMPEKAGDGKNWLVIDDLVDSGNTFKIAREHLPEAHYACVYAKPDGVPTVETFITEVSQDTWIHFPWDLEARYSTPIADIKDSRHAAER